MQSRNKKVARMRIKSIQIALLSLPIALAGCLSPQAERQVGGAAIGAGTGFIAGTILDLDDGWLAASTLAGAAAGTLIATNTARNECAYATGDGGYRTEAC
jgi:uncharacterized protein YcfJ